MGSRSLTYIEESYQTAVADEENNNESSDESSDKEEE